MQIAAVRRYVGAPVPLRARRAGTNNRKYLAERPNQEGEGARAGETRGAGFIAPPRVAVKSVLGLGVSALIGAITVVLDAYKEGRIDRLFLVHNAFVNTMSQKAEITTLLPAVIFGTYQELVKSLSAWTERQWDNVWPRTAEFRFDLANAMVMASPNRFDSS